MRTKSRRMVEKGSRGESQLLFWHLFSLIDDNANCSVLLFGGGGRSRLLSFALSLSRRWRCWLFPFFRRYFLGLSTPGHRRSLLRLQQLLCPSPLCGKCITEYLVYYGRWRRQSDSQKERGSRDWVHRIGVFAGDVSGKVREHDMQFVGADWPARAN